MTFVEKKKPFCLEITFICIIKIIENQCIKLCNRFEGMLNKIKFFCLKIAEFFFIFLKITQKKVKKALFQLKKTNPALAKKQAHQCLFLFSHAYFLDFL